MHDLGKDLVAETPFGLAPEEVVEADFVEGRGRRVRGQMAPEPVHPLIRPGHHDGGVPSHVVTDAGLKSRVAREHRLGIDGDGVHVVCRRSGHDVGAPSASPARTRSSSWLARSTPPTAMSAPTDSSHSLVSPGSGSGIAVLLTSIVDGWSGCRLMIGGNPSAAIVGRVARVHITGSLPNIAAENPTVRQAAEDRRSTVTRWVASPSLAVAGALRGSRSSVLP